MRFIFLMQTIAKHDAIGNDIWHMLQVLKGSGECFAYGEYILRDDIEKLSQKDVRIMLTKTDTVVFYEHCTYWEEGERLLALCRGKLIFRYHNITPSEYFAPYYEPYAENCRLGREQTERFIQNYPDAFWLSDSSYNDCELKSVPKAKRFVLMPFNNLSAWRDTVPDERLLSALINSNEVHLLFVGRIAPNKGHKLLLDIIKCYCINYGTDIKLLLVGKKDDALSDYFDELEEIIRNYRIKPNVEFIGEITDSTLLSYYLGADFFVSASDHEGFGVPLLEAQYLHLPVIAKNTSAVDETVGSLQLLLGDDPRDYAAAIKILYENKEYKSFLQLKGYENYKKRFDNLHAIKVFEAFIDEVLK